MRDPHVGKIKEGLMANQGSYLVYGLCNGWVIFCDCIFFSLDYMTVARRSWQGVTLGNCAPTNPEGQDFFRGGAYRPKTSNMSRHMKCIKK